jgi:hypothetical protein
MCRSQWQTENKASCNHWWTTRLRSSVNFVDSDSPVWSWGWLDLSFHSAWPSLPWQCHPRADVCVVPARDRALRDPWDLQ